MRGEDVVAALNRIIERRPAPKCLFVDNGSEFSGQLLDLWAYHHQAKIDFSRPGKPTDNCFIETFNGSLRDECLNIHWFASLARPRQSSKPGAGTTMRAVLTWLSGTGHRLHSPGKSGLERHETGL